MTPQFYRQVGELVPGQRASASFGLVPAPETKKPDFSFGLLSDPQDLNKTDAGREIFESRLGEINKLTAKPAFLTIAGDLTDDSTDAEFMRYKTTAATSRVPIWPVAGNHDFGDSDIYDNYREYLGPEWYSFDYGSRHFVVLENTSAFADPLQIAWLRNDLARHAQNGEELVVIAHRPLEAPPTGGGANSPAPFIDLMEQYNIKLVLTGHTHKNDVDLTAVDGAAHIVTNSTANPLDQTPPGFRVVTFAGSKVTYPFTMYEVNKSLTITNPAPGAEIAHGATTVQVNAYNTSSRVTDVRYRIDGGDWKKLAQSSHFTWFAQATGRKLKYGGHAIEVRATDDSGATWNETSRFTVVKAKELAAPRQGTDWSMFKGGSAYTGVAADVLGPDLQLAWSYRTPGTILTSSPVIVDGIVYAGTRDENGAENHAIHAVDFETGKRLWTYRTDGQAEGTPVVADGIVFAATVRGTLFALDATTGKKIWSITKGDEVGDGVHRGWMYEQPNYADGVVYQVYSNGERRLMALDAASGKQMWDSRLDGGWISETPPALGDGRLYVGGDNDWLVALNAADGTEAWRNDPASCTNTTPTFANGLLYLGCEGDELVVVDAATGQEVWRYTSPDESYLGGTPTGSSPAISNGVAYMGFNDGNLTALDARTGKLLWTRRTGNGITSSPVVSGNTVYFGSNDGFVYGLDRVTGNTSWRFEVGAWVSSSPAISGNTLVIGAWDGNLYAFTGQSGAGRR